MKHSLANGFQLLFSFPLYMEVNLAWTYLNICKLH